jgi:GntR family transcriptional regulator
VDAAAVVELDEHAITAIADPIERARIIRAIATERRTLPPALARIYRATLREIRGDGERKLVWIARKVGISPGRVSQLTNPKLLPEGVAS